MSNDALKAELEALRVKLKPEPTEAERKALAEEAELRKQLAAARAALRDQENADIVAKYAPKKTRRFFDFDPDNEHPTFVDYGGVSCMLYTRFVVRGANADQLERHSDAITVKGLAKDGTPDVSIDTAKMQAVSIECAETCIVYPTAESAGVSPEQHALNVKASLWYLGAARAEVGKAAIELGGVEAAARRSKS